MADLNAFNARQKYSHFCILVIGRANAGKTTLLKRVCNTTEDPCIYNEVVMCRLRLGLKAPALAWL